jgi:mRNA interferase RelE/StbE
MTYTVIVPHAVEMQILRVPEQDRLKVRGRIAKLAEDPYPHGYDKLKGVENQWRIREGRWRIVYSIFKRQLLIEVVEVDDRKDVYR